MKRILLAVTLGLVGLLARPAPVIQVTAVATPIAELVEAGSYRVTFQVTADEMTTLWHTNSSDFLFVVWDVWAWQAATVEFVTAEPVTLYAEGFGCYQVCGKIRHLRIERIDADIGGQKE